MSANDIRPYSYPGSTGPVIFEAPMKASETFRVGEPISIDANGLATESGDDPVPMDFAGIALAPAGYTIGTVNAAGTASTKNPATGAAYATNDMIPYVAALQGATFISNNFATDGAGTQVFPLANATALGLVGEAVGMSLTAGVWSIDSGGTADREVFRIIRFLDAQGRNVSRSGQAATAVVVTPIQSMWFPITDAAGSLVAIA